MRTEFVRSVHKSEALGTSKPVVNKCLLSRIIFTVVLFITHIGLRVEGLREMINAKCLDKNLKFRIVRYKNVQHS